LPITLMLLLGKFEFKFKFESTPNKIQIKNQIFTLAGYKS
jgi:hypothetical protein